MALSPTVGRALRASVARPGVTASFEGVLADAPPGALDGMAAAAGFHGIPGYVLAAAQGSGCVSGATLEQLEDLRNDALFIHLRALADVRRLAEVWDPAGVPWLVVKGPVLSEIVHVRPDLRTYGDLDVLVHPSRFAAAFDVLEAAGCRFLEPDWGLVRRELKGEVRVRLPGGTVADVHWHLLNDRAIRDAFRIRTAELFSRVREVDLGGTTVRTLDEVDTVVYLSMHTMLSGADRLIWLKDIEQAMERGGVTASQVEARAAEWGAGLVVATATDRVRRAIGVPERMAVLRPARVPHRAWVGASAVAWRWRPAEREDGSGSLGRLVARSVRPSALASARVLMRKTLAHLRGADRRRDLDSSQRSPVSESAAERRAYLDTVARQE